VTPLPIIALLSAIVLLERHSVAAMVMTVRFAGTVFAVISIVVVSVAAIVHSNTDELWRRICARSERSHQRCAQKSPARKRLCRFLESPLALARWCQRPAKRNPALSLPFNLFPIARSSELLVWSRGRKSGIADEIIRYFDDRNARRRNPIILFDGIL